MPPDGTVAFGVGNATGCPGLVSATRTGSIDTRAGGTGGAKGVTGALGPLGPDDPRSLLVTTVKV